MTSLDRRRHAYRADLAASALRDIVSAPRYADPQPMQVRVASTPLRRAPDVTLGYDTELIAGEIFDVYDRADGFAWGQARRDGYVGYCPEEALGPLLPAATHRVADLRAFLYPSASMKATPVGFLPYGAEIAASDEQSGYLRTPLGHVYAKHLRPLAERPVDPVGEAERFLGIPYLWGGKSSLGLDCSGLVQTVCSASGILAPRDSDMQEQELGSPLAMPDDPATLPRGALLFWPGHVALSQGGGRMIHATSFSMSVISEPIAPALQRIEQQGPGLRSVRLLPGM
ncbi:MAG: C40 family peptidase [Beijerinckiaceae bacterium]|nr:C40 family peptidase [Beijerinckiaceae bacterium]